MAVGLQFQEITQQDADWVLTARDSGNLKRANKVRARVFARGPEEVSSVAGTWRRLEQAESGRTYRQRRNDLVHGTGSADLTVLREGVDLIVGAVLSDGLLSVLEVPVRFGDGAGEVVPLPRGLLLHEISTAESRWSRKRIRPSGRHAARYRSRTAPVGRRSVPTLCVLGAESSGFVGGG